MSISKDKISSQSVVKVFGIGGAGSNAVDYLYKVGVPDISFFILNTDKEALNYSKIPNKIQIGKTLTRGLGSGANPNIGRLSAEKSLNEIKTAIGMNTKLLVLVAGMGGGTGTGATPIVAALCRQLGILTVAIISYPFAYEGKKRIKQAEEGIKNLEENVNTLMVLSNDDLRKQYGNLKMKDAFRKSDETIAAAIKCLTDTIASTGQINVDFADVRTVLSNGGYSSLGIGIANGHDRALKAITNVFESPLFKSQKSILNAKWILMNINSSEGKDEFSMDEVEIIQNFALEHVGDDCDVILGLGYDNSLVDSISITLIATGFGKTLVRKSPDIFDNSETVLPYALKQLYIKNFRSVKELHISKIPVDTPWIFFTGENGSGKTTLLQAITIGLLGSVDNETILLQDDRTDIILEIKTPYGNLIDLSLKKYETSPKLVCYGPSRLLIQSDYSQNEIDKKTNTSYGIFNADGILLNIENDLLYWKLNNNDRFKIVSDILKEILPEIEDIIVEKNKVYYIDKILNTKIVFEQLPSGYRSVVAFIGDLLVRFYKYAENIIWPKDFEGIVIIDELDLHWHPKWQRTIPKLLSTLFPKIQFIATTHSALPFLGAPANSTFFKISKIYGRGTDAENIKIDVTSLLPNLLLTSSLFDMDDISHVDNKDVELVRTEDSFTEMMENLEIEKGLEDFEKSEITYSKIKMTLKEVDQNKKKYK